MESVHVSVVINVQHAHREQIELICAEHDFDFYSHTFRLAELMNDEAKGKNVVTCVVVPSTIDTPQNRKAMPAANFDNWVKAEAIADVIYYNCTTNASILRETVLKVYNNA